MTALPNDLPPDFTMGGSPIHTDNNHNGSGNPHPQYVICTLPNRSNASTTANRIFKLATITIKKADVWVMADLRYYRSDLNSAVFEPFGKLRIKVGVISSTNTQYVILKADEPNSFCEFYSNIVSQTATSITVDIYIKDLESTSINTRYQFTSLMIDSYNPPYTSFTFYNSTDWISALPGTAVVCNYSINYRSSGTTANRPTAGVYVGMPYFDTTLGKPVWYKTTSTWVDATGATV